MPAGKYSFTIEQGATLNFEIQYKDSNNVPIDLTGGEGRMQIRVTKDNPVYLLNLSSSLQPDGTGLNFNGANGITDPISGSIGVYISAVSSSLLNFDTAFYDLEIQLGTEVFRVLEGEVKLSKEVTR